jgi:negative regulator of genetic competence, sporulation and motility
MYYITQNENGLITGRYTTDIHGNNIPTDAVEVTEEIFNTSMQMHRSALVNNELVELPPEAPTQEQLNQQAKSAVYTLLDQTANIYDYKNFAEVVQFVNSATWKAEADGLLAWQDAVWTKAYELLKEPITNIDDFIAQLPKYVSSTSTNN